MTRVLRVGTSVVYSMPLGVVIVVVERNSGVGGGDGVWLRLLLLLVARYSGGGGGVNGTGVTGDAAGDANEYGYVDGDAGGYAAEDEDEDDVGMPTIGFFFRRFML